MECTWCTLVLNGKVWNVLIYSSFEIFTKHIIICKFCLAISVNPMRGKSIVILFLQPMLFSLFSIIEGIIVQSAQDVETIFFSSAAFLTCLLVLILPLPRTLSILAAILECCWVTTGESLIALHYWRGTTAKEWTFSPKSQTLFTYPLCKCSKLPQGKCTS